MKFSTLVFLPILTSIIAVVGAPVAFPTGLSGGNVST